MTNVIPLRSYSHKKCFILSLDLLSSKQSLFTLIILTMKTILLATDFSKAADSASAQAAQLAALLHTRLILVHIYQDSMNIFSLDPHTTRIKKNKISSLRKLSRLRDRLQNAYNGLLNISVIAEEGPTLETINEVAMRHRADLIIMGTMGEKSPGARYFGSQATEMILKTAIPILLVPPNITVTPFKNMVIAIDLSKPVDAGELDEVILFAERFKAKPDIVCMSENPKESSVQKASEHIRHLMMNYPHTLAIVEGHDLVSILSGFEKRTEADLLVILPRPHNKRIFSVLESVSEKIARQSKIPVLVVV